MDRVVFSFIWLVVLAYGDWYVIQHGYYSWLWFTVPALFIQCVFFAYQTSDYRFRWRAWKLIKGAREKTYNDEDQGR